MEECPNCKGGNDAFMMLHSDNGSCAVCGWTVPHEVGIRSAVVECKVREAIAMLRLYLRQYEYGDGFRSFNLDRAIAAIKLAGDLDQGRVPITHGKRTKRKDATRDTVS